MYENELDKNYHFISGMKLELVWTNIGNDQVLENGAVTVLSAWRLILRKNQIKSKY